MMVGDTPPLAAPPHGGSPAPADLAGTAGTTVDLGCAITLARATNNLAALNTMLDQIEIRDTQLSDYRRNLENKVEERTRELVIAKFSSQSIGLDAEKMALTSRWVHAVRDFVTG